MQSVIHEESKKEKTQPWLSSAGWDLFFIISPAFLTSFVVLLFAPVLQGSRDLPLWAWVTFVLLVDVSHVYSSLFRTYFNRAAFEKNSMLLMVIPVLCWMVGCLLYSLDAMAFWRVLAYVAVFHFIRQQYGFMTLYSRKEPERYRPWRRLDAACIYASTLFPLIYWHTHLPRNFNWFVSGDFVESLPVWLSSAALIAYAVIGVAYLVKEFVMIRLTHYRNIPKNLIIAGTALSWWTGIVALDSDIAFTITNVVTHGVPYMALIWLYHSVGKSGAGRPADAASRKSLAANVSATAPASDRFVRIALTYLPVFLLVLAGLAFLEEGLWDGFIWREHLAFFSVFSSLPAVTDKSILALLVPLLALPQSTHYVLDGFIWRVKDRQSIWSA